MEIDGKINSGITTNEFLVGNLEYNSTHTFRVRAVNSDGTYNFGVVVISTLANSLPSVAYLFKLGVSS